MEYTISKLAKLSGLTTRTLRYYDEIGLLSPTRNQDNDYRLYGQEEVDLLQQILFYREMGVGLEEIKGILYDKDFDALEALEDHLEKLTQRKRQLSQLITTVKKTISAYKGENDMNNEEKFRGFKEKLIEENEKTYGKEIREKYGDDVVDKSNQKLAAMTSEEYAHWKELEEEISSTLKEAVLQGDPNSTLGQKLAALHQEWIKLSWGSYSKDAHLGLARMYVEDPRFKKYYDDVVEGGAEFLLSALESYLGK